MDPVPAEVASPGLPSFALPPVVEVALSLAFRPVARLRTIELVRLWDALFFKEFPRGEEQQPYQMPIERFDRAVALQQVGLQFSAGLPTPRLLLHSPGGDQTIQLQNNYFARNWRKADQGAYPVYPRYPRLEVPFAADLSKLESYLSSRKLGGFEPVQCELTYINHIENRSGKPDLGDILTLVSREPSADDADERESMRVAAQYLISQDGIGLGRIHVSADPAVRRSDNASITVLKLTARGKPIGDGIEGVLRFLRLAHIRTVATFVAITRTEMHQQWGKSTDD